MTSVYRKNIFEVDYNQVIKLKISGYFILVDLDGIVFLLAFLEEKPSDENVSICNFLTNVQSSIKDSHSLSQKVKRCFESLTVSKENMERVSQALIFSCKHQFLEVKDKCELLSTSLSPLSSNEYNMCWFQFFLANSEVWKNIDQKLREGYFQMWTQSAIEDFRNQSDFLKNTDKLLGALDKTPANDEFQIVVINKLITYCHYHEGDLLFEAIQSLIVFFL